MASSSSSKGPKVEEETKTTMPNWVDLPKDVTTKIFSKVGSQIEILKGALCVCPVWRNILKDPLLWRKIEMRVRGTSLADKYDLVKMCCYAISLSSGQLEEVDVEVFGNDSLLQRIADSSSSVRRLRLAFCTGISDYMVTYAAKKLPLLEELDVSYTALSKNTLEAIGQSCPLLKVLKFGSMRSIVYKGGVKCDEEAIAIGKTIPNLCNLQIWGNNMNDAGLVAILDGCPHLESLDIRGCYNLHLQGSLRKRLDEQIKEFLHPLEYLYYDDDDNDPYADLYCDGGITESSEDEEAFAYRQADYLGLL